MITFIDCTIKGAGILENLKFKGIYVTGYGPVTFRNCTFAVGD